MTDEQKRVIRRRVPAVVLVIAGVNLGFAILIVAEFGLWWVLGVTVIHLAVAAYVFETSCVREP